MQQPSLSALLNAAVTVLIQAIQDPINEIQGDLTTDIIRRWINSTLPKVAQQAKSSALYYDQKKQLILVAILDEKNEILFTDRGDKIAVVYKAKSLDQDLIDLFKNSKTILIPLDHEVSENVRVHND